MVGREVVHWCYLTSGLELRLSSDVVNGVTMECAHGSVLGVL